MNYEFRDNFLIGVTNISKNEDESFEFNFSDGDNYLTKMNITQINGRALKI